MKQATTQTTATPDVITLHELVKAINMLEEASQRHYIDLLLKRTHGYGVKVIKNRLFLWPTNDSAV